MYPHGTKNKKVGPIIKEKKTKAEEKVAV